MKEEWDEIGGGRQRRRQLRGRRWRARGRRRMWRGRRREADVEGEEEGGRGGGVGGGGEGGRRMRRGRRRAEDGGRSRNWRGSSPLRSLPPPLSFSTVVSFPSTSLSQPPLCRLLLFFPLLLRLPPLLPPPPPPPILIFFNIKKELKRVFTSLSLKFL